jgi:hypothetical protein
MLIIFHFITLHFRMLKLSKEGMKEEAEVINQMLMPLHERYGMQHTVRYGHRHHSPV